MPLIVLLMAGVVDFGRYYWTQNSMQLAVEETARWVMVTGTTSQSSVQTYLRNRVSAVTGTSVTVSVTVASSGSVNYATIGAQHSFTSIFTSFVPALGSRQIQVQVKVPVVT